MTFGAWLGDTATEVPAFNDKTGGLGFQLSRLARTLASRGPGGGQTATNDPARPDPATTHLLLAEDLSAARPHVSQLEKIIPTQDNLGNMITELRESLTGEEHDDYGVLRPTTYAFNTILDLLFTAAVEMGEGRTFPYGSVTTDRDGGIRIEWRNGERNVRLIVPSRQEGMRYIYFEEGEEYRAIPVVTAAELRRRLEALSGV
jgi:hypothetical protein